MVATLVVAITALLATHLYRTRGLDLFGPGSGRLGAQRAPGQPIYFGVLGAADASVVVDDLRPRIVSNSARGTVSFTLCRLRDRRCSLGSAGASEVANLCARHETFRPGRSRLAEEDGFDLVLMRVTLGRAGSMDIAGTQIRYHRGDRSGDQLAGEAVEVYTDRLLSRDP